MSQRALPCRARCVPVAPCLASPCGGCRAASPPFQLNIAIALVVLHSPPLRCIKLSERKKEHRQPEGGWEDGKGKRGVPVQFLLQASAPLGTTRPSTRRSFVHRLIHFRFCISSSRRSTFFRSAHSQVGMGKKKRRLPFLATVILAALAASIAGTLALIVVTNRISDGEEQSFSQRLRRSR